MTRKQLIKAGMLAALAVRPSTGLAAEGFTALGAAGHDGCSLAGVFAGSDAEGGVDLAHLYALPQQTRLVEGGFEVAAYRSRGREFVEVSLNVEVADGAGLSACAAESYPAATVAPMPVASGRLVFFAGIPGLGVTVQGGGPLDLFARSQWIGVTLAGADLFARLAEGGPGRLFSSVLAGVVDWTAVPPAGGSVTVRSAFSLPASDDAALMRAVRGQLPDRD